MSSEADGAQNVASDPAVSAFVAASAGSGKTKLLTDRLLRLMLAGADPGRIQCLTFTKAAAAEMANRLQSRLSAWVTISDAKLDADLAGFGMTPSSALRERSRALFARVLDQPGGMRIGTIHAFCQSLLRRFPLEAQLPPHFRLLEENDAGIALRDAREDMLAEAHTEERRAALRTLAGLVSLDGFGRLVAELQTDRDRLDRAACLQPNGVVAALDRIVGARRATDARDAVAWIGEPALRRAAEALAKKGSPAKAEGAERMLAWLSLNADERVESWGEWRKIFFRADGVPREPGGLINDKLAKAEPDVAAELFREQARIVAFEDTLRAAKVADVSAALLSLAAPVAGAYAARKAAGDQLDFADLIGRTNTLLVDPGAAWVLYKLDGGLDHLLLDEVQDTAPAQWNIAGALTAEFFAGAGARDCRRTVFAVGDRKQSIYSFQGADPDGFEHWRGKLKKRVLDAGETWRDVKLNVSFRSTAPVLALVDAVFADPVAAKGVEDGLRHTAHRAGHAGSVELWPLTPVPDDAPAEPWHVPEQNLPGSNAPQRLAEALAEWIGKETDGSVMSSSRGRPLAAGDVLVLVRTRNEFARALVRALKQRDVPVAGIDRMVLTDQPAVADLLALCDALLLPEDELQFACMLTSPIGGLSDDSLMRLALGRSGTLWHALQSRADDCAEWRAARDLFKALLARVDYATPHALLAEALGPLGARARLLARLGPEAAEPIDELLGAALAYANAHPPSLQGFLHWLRQSGATVKREAEGDGHAVRIMTVHGAKGLQAPLVILPETVTMPRDDGQLIWAADEASGTEVPVWSPRAELRCAAADRLRAAEAERDREEYHRLLYVALTRAEDRLVVCGWQTRRKAAEGNWYELVERGFARLPDTETVPFDGVTDPWPGSIIRHAMPQRVPLSLKSPGSVVAGAAAPLPAWAGRAPDWSPAPAPAELALPQPLAPSQPQDADLGSVPAAASPLLARNAGTDRFKRGRLIHALLQHLPALPAEARAAAAERYLARPGTGIDAADVGGLVGEVVAVLEHATLAPLFGPSGRAEVPLTGVVDGTVIGGLVDRLAVLPDRVLLADYKTNRTPPRRVDAVPVLYLRQMAAYRAVLRGAFPGRAVTCALVWTTAAAVMELPDDLLDRHVPHAIAAA